MNKWGQNWIKILRWSEQYTQTDMVYLMHGGLWLLLGKAGTVFILALTMVAFANWLPQTSYGTYQYVVAVMGLLGIFSLPGLNTALVKSIAQKKEGDLSLIVQTKFQWALIGSLGVLMFSAWYVYQKQYLLGLALGIGGVFLPFYTVLPIFEAYWNGKKRFDVKTTYEVIAALFAAVCTITAVYATSNIAVILLVSFASYAAINGFFLWRTLQQTTNNEHHAESINLGKDLTMIMAIWTVAEYADKIILWKFLGPAQLAIYAFASQPLQKIIAFNPMSALSLPKISEGNATHIYESLMKKFFRSFMVTLPMAALLSLAAPFAYRILFPQYTESVLYFQALSVLIALAPFVLINTALVVEMRKKELYIANAAKAILKIALYLLLVPLWGIWGIVAGSIAGAVIGNVLLLYFFLNIRNYFLRPASVL